MIQLITIIFTVLAFALTIARAVSPTLSPLLGKWQWLPPALVLFCAFMSARLVSILGAPPVFSPDGEIALQLVDSLAQAVVGLIQAYQQGHGYPTSAGGSSKVGIGALVLVVLLSSGCTPQQGAKTVPVICQDVAYRAVDQTCGALVEKLTGKDEQDAILLACETIIRAQTKVCEPDRKAHV